MAAARVLWKEQQKQLDPGRLVFIDETGTSTNMARLRGRCPRGQRLIGKVPHGHWKITTFVAALRSAPIGMLRHPRTSRRMLISEPQARVGRFCGFMLENLIRKRIA